MNNLITATQAAELRDQHNYPSEHITALSLGQISQMIEEAAPYTNFIVLDGLLFDGKIAGPLTDVGYYIDTLIAHDSKEVFTLIQWPTI